MFLLLVLGAITSFLLGIGLTISACYIFLAMLLAPTLVNIGIHEMSAHLFLVYWGSVSYITPPVALAAYAASSIAQANPLQTAFQAVKLGFVSLLVPFFFVYDPALVGHGTAFAIIRGMATAAFGIVLVDQPLVLYAHKGAFLRYHRHYPARRVPYLERRHVDIGLLQVPGLVDHASAQPQMADLFPRNLLNAYFRNDLAVAVF